jgi:hypothetical protein
VNGADPAPGEPDDLGALKDPVRLPEEQAEDALLHGREERVREPMTSRGVLLCSHIGNTHT